MLVSGAIGGSGFFLSATVRLWTGIIAVLYGLILWWRERKRQT